MAKSDFGSKFLSRKVGKIAVLVLSLSIVMILAAVSNFVLKPVKIGFLCDNDELSYPYKAKSTISTAVLFLVSIPVPILIIIVTELAANISLRQQWRQLTPNLALACHRFLFGYALTIVVTMTIKKTAGQLRPNFLAVCQPVTEDLVNIACTRGHYVENFTCLQQDEDLLNDARMSFPSGHTSFALYSATFTTIYLNIRGADWPMLEFPKLLVQGGAFLLAAASAVSRITDNKHHWRDVVGGAVVGCLIAMAMFSTQLSAMLNGRCPDKAAVSPRGEFCSGTTGHGQREEVEIAMCLQGSSPDREKQKTPATGTTVLAVAE